MTKQEAIAAIERHRTLTWEADECRGPSDLAARMAKACIEKTEAEPTWCAPSGDGGCYVKWEIDGIEYGVEIHDDGEINFMAFKGNRLKLSVWIPAVPLIEVPTRVDEVPTT